MAGPQSLRVKCSTYLRTADHAEAEQGLSRRFGGHGLVRANGQRRLDIARDGAAGDGIFGGDFTMGLGLVAWVFGWGRELFLLNLEQIGFA